ncbi:hypothetical protein G7Z17_g145 [Cylindrodendrum hubeiense]|uniref:PrpF protein n=1 Tax=Cylindrodendrum hubeiense TaxID=595255 RepID=A0A9P5HQD8_9HYPO|nr:hypothetical protein G7Z17_g145 [Cylindrodendrum hubeiense]
MSAAVGPYAIDSGLVPVPPGAENATVRIHNTNTGKAIEAGFPVVNGEASAYGDFGIDGVAGTAAKIELKFIDPAGSKTGKLFPTGAVTEEIDGVQATCIDAGNPCCFLQAVDLGVAGTITPQQIEDHPTLSAKLEAIRRKAGVKMGIAETESNVPGSVPKIAIVSPPADMTADNVVIRAMSVGQPHKSIPVTVALAAASAANVAGSVVAKCLAGGSLVGSEVTINHASGSLVVAADFDAVGTLRSATVFRTARRLMEGRVFWK